MNLKTILRTIRPTFLVLTPVCVFLGMSVSVATGTTIDWFKFLLVISGAIFSHIGVNTLNEYLDFKSGLDLVTEKTAFSGGSGALPENPEMADYVLLFGLFSLFLSILVGLYLLMEVGLIILPVGLLGLILVISYTQWINRNALLCLIAPGVGFGVLMVVGTDVSLAGSHSLKALLVSLVPFFLMNNLLLLNQFPDMKADASVGRKTFPIVYGLKISNIVYAVSALAAFSLIVVYIIAGYIPVLSVIALVPLVFSAVALKGAVQYMSEVKDHPGYMAANVIAALTTPLFLGIAIILG